MPDIDEGLEINGQPARTYEDGDVNTQSGFEAALADKVIGEEPQPRGPDGRYIREEEEEPLPGDEGDTVEVPDEQDAAYWQTKFEEMQKLVTRQGDELGELRRYVADASQREPDLVPAPQQTVGPLDLETMFEEADGHEVMEWLIDNAPEQIEKAVTTWALSGDPAGMVYFTNYRAAQVEQASPQAEPAPADPALQQLAIQQNLTEVWREARANDPLFSSYEDGIVAALDSQETPQEIKEMLFSGDPDHMRSAAAFLRPYAQLEAMKASAQAAQPEDSPEPSFDEGTPAEQERREQIRRTAIVTGSQRLQSAGAQPEGAGELSRDERIARFKDMFDEEPSTSISAGLTINGQPVLPARPRRSR